MAVTNKKLQKIMTQPIVIKKKKKKKKERKTKTKIHADAQSCLASRKPATCRTYHSICSPLSQNQIFRFFTNKTMVQIWLYDKPDTRIEGKILGFDEYMNMVLDESAEVSVKKNTRKDLGKILLKGDTITLIMEAKKAEEEEE
ncbi:small nuclear ribonucleoprotein E, putative [Plasmodium knowlesi strain H]|uniref:Small nuclear ribonucleoprotein E n=1 Tax=Plasmodium knowlesi (strain H) TaxID=5851 RepID=A0A1A7VXX0_PLAKH|nr:small nuclear ribonucleoprotein E, putative [Plasmodium knowlesi strain H]